MLSTSSRHKLLVPFLTAGYPTLDGTLKLTETAIAAGADIIEIGVPFSDPLADGPEIQHSSHVALQNGITLLKVLELVERIRTSTSIPIILMGYYNPIVAFGASRFLRAAKKSGVDGLIIPDLPIEEASVLRTQMSEVDLSAVFLVAPTSPDKRIKLIDHSCSDFVYAVTVAGVTGTGKKFDESTESYLHHLRQVLKKPFVAGFGISSAPTARRMSEYADGVVIGSALIRILREATSFKEGRAKVGNLLAAVRREM